MKRPSSGSWHDHHVKELEALANSSAVYVSAIPAVFSDKDDVVRFVVAVLEKPSVPSFFQRGYTSNNGRAGRKRRYERPLFITPEGVLEAFPTTEKDFFRSARAAFLAVLQHGYELADVVITETTIQKQLSDRQYLMWRKREARRVFSHVPK